jgi:hypothetical protein
MMKDLVDCMTMVIPPMHEHYQRHYPLYHYHHHYLRDHHHWNHNLLDYLLIPLISGLVSDAHYYHLRASLSLSLSLSLSVCVCVCV